MHLQVYFRPYLKVENLKQPFRLHDTKYKQTFPRNFSYLSFSNRGSINSFLVFVCSDKSLIHRITRKNAKKNRRNFLLALQRFLVCLHFIITETSALANLKDFESTFALARLIVYKHYSVSSENGEFVQIEAKS